MFLRVATIRRHKGQFSENLNDTMSDIPIRHTAFRAHNYANNILLFVNATFNATNELNPYMYCYTSDRDTRCTRND